MAGGQETFVFVRWLSEATEITILGKYEQELLETHHKIGVFPLSFVW